MAIRTGSSRGRRMPWTGRSFGLRPRMIIYFGILFIVIVIAMKYAELYGVPYTAFSGEISDLRADAFDDLNLIADLKKERLERWVEERRNDAVVLADSVEVQRDLQQVLPAFPRADADGAVALGRSGLLTEDDDAYLRLTNHLVLVKEAYGVYDSIGIADARTGLIVVSTDQSAVGRGVSNEEFFFEALALGAGEQFFHVVDDFHRSSGQQPIPELFVSQKIPVPDAGGEIAGVLIMQAGLDDIIGAILYTGDGLGRTGEALLVGRDATILTSLAHPLADGSQAEPLRYQISAQPASLAAGGLSGIMSSKDYRGVQVLAAYRHIPITPELGWGLVIKQDEAEVFGALRQSVTYTAWIAITGIVLVLVIAFVVATGLTRPIRALERAATRFGRGDRRARVAETSGDEIGRLGHEFNAMAASLVQRELEIRQRSSQLEAANKELAAFTYSVSHDLRSPLRTVDGFTRILEQDHGPELSDEVRRYLQLIRGGAQQMGTLIDDLLAFSRLGQRPIKKKKVDPSPVVRQALSDLHMEQKDRCIEMTIRQLPECEADPALLRQVYANLLSNSLKFTRPRDPAVIEVGAIAKNGKTIYFVRDNGVGFDMKYAEKLFGVFQRLHRAEEFEGTGVGTAIAQRIVHRHGGAIWAESQVDMGATFFFTLPTGATDGS